MKIAFINPTLGGDYSALDIAITMLATYLNQRTKHRASICDLTFHRRDWKRHIRRHLEKEKPDAIGISGNSLYMGHIQRITAEVKKEADIPVILGGYHPSLHPEETLLSPGVDAICIGDGEHAISEYLDRLSARESLKGIAGLWYKQGEDIVRTPGGCFNPDLDSLPIPDWDLWEDLEKYFYFLGMLYFIGTRGCTYRCSYCDAHEISQHVGGRYYRIRDPVSYADEIAYQFKRYRGKGLRLAQLFDQIPTLDIGWLKAFCDRYVELGMHARLPFSMFSRIDHLDEEKLRLLGRSGCAILRVGIESGNDHIRNDIYRKRISSDQIRKVISSGKRRGINFTAYYILGGPAETRDTINETIKFAEELDAERSAFFIYKPFTQEGLDQIADHGGKVDPGRQADNITFKAVVNLKDVTADQVEALQRKAYMRTFGRRMLHVIRKRNLTYAREMLTYLARGAYHGLDLSYLVPYSHIYGYDNVLGRYS